MKVINNCAILPFSGEINMANDMDSAPEEILISFLVRICFD